MRVIWQKVLRKEGGIVMTIEERAKEYADKQPEAEDFEKNQYPNFVPKDWSECYKLPLHLDDYCVYAWDAESGMALSSFNLKYDEEGNYLHGEQERIKHVIDVINGDCSSDFEPEWDISNDDPCKITYKGKQQFLVRGWVYRLYT